MVEREDKREPAAEAGDLDEALLKAISHPLRHRLLSLLDDRVASPNELARELLRGFAAAVENTGRPG